MGCDQNKLTLTTTTITTYNHPTATATYNHPTQWQAKETYTNMINNQLTYHPMAELFK